MGRCLPAGRLALLFSDIEGSTRLLHRLGTAYAVLLEQKKRIFRDCFAEHGGVEVDTQGDAFFVVFRSAAAAFDTAIAIHRALLIHSWPEGVAVRVRIGIHCGTPSLVADGYVGIELHEAARICAAAHGGQTLVGDAARRETEGVDADWRLRPLGRFHLKDIPASMLLHQLVAPDLPAEFPPPRTIDARPNNLPAETTEFIGRINDLALVIEQVRAHRLVNLLGPGGTGKTRIALAAARALLGDFADGVFLVRLDTLDDAERVLPTIAQVLGLSPDGEGPLQERVAAALRPKSMLLVLDNFEHLLVATPLVSALLAAAAGLKVLSTSQAVLHCSGETVVSIPPLGLPSPDVTESCEKLRACDSVELFVQRARAADPAFALTPANVADVAGIVTRLEGNALAIELAAARVRLFPPDRLLQRLDDRFRLLSGGNADQPRRHRALLDLVAWSYGLLLPAEQALMRRLAVFRGGFTLDAAENVGGGEPVEDVLMTLQALIDKSLVRREEQSADVRFSMLDTIREFALRELERQGEAARVKSLHAGHFLAFVRAAEPNFTRAGQRGIQALLAEDEHNLRAAMATLRESGSLDEGLAMARALWRYWHAMGHLDEGREVLASLLNQDGASDAARAKALMALGGLAYWQADYPAARIAYEQALDLFRAGGDGAQVAEALFALSTTCTWSGHGEEGQSLAEQALAGFRALRDRNGIGRVQMAAGFALWMAGDLAGARVLWEESLAIAREEGDHVEAATKVLALAALRFQQGERNEPIGMAVQSLVELVERHNVSHVVMALDFTAALLVHQDPDAGCRLAGAAEALRAALGGGMRPESCHLTPARQVAESRLGPATAERLFAEGKSLRLDDAVRLARVKFCDASAASAAIEQTEV